MLKLLNYLVDVCVYIAYGQDEKQVKRLKTVIQRTEASGSSPYVAYYIDYYGQGCRKLYGEAKGRTSWKVKHSTGQGQYISSLRRGRLSIER